MYLALSVIFVCIFFDLDPAKSFPLHFAAKEVAKQLGKLVEANVKSVSLTTWVKTMADKVQENEGALKNWGVHMIRRLLDTGLSVEEVAWSQVLPTACAMVPNQAQVV